MIRQTDPHMSLKNGRKLRRVLVYALLLAAILAAGAFIGAFDFAKGGDLFAFDGAWLLGLLAQVVAILLLGNGIVAVLRAVKPKKHRTRSILSLTASLMKYLMFLVILCVVLTAVGVDISTVVASVGVFALIVGFSAESLIADVVTGTFMLLENQYNVGDIVEVGGFRGTVTAIGIRTTCITDAGDNIKIINNSEMKSILNRSDNSSYAVCDIAIPYETDLEAFEAKLPALLQSVREAHAALMETPPEYLGVQALEPSGILLRFAARVSEKNIYAAMRAMNRDLLLGFRALGVACPYPHLDVRSR